MTKVGTYRSSLLFSAPMWGLLLACAALGCSTPSKEPPPAAATGTAEAAPTDPADAPAQQPEAPAKATAPEPVASMPGEPAAADAAGDAAEPDLRDREPHPGLRDPSRANLTAPEGYTALLATTKGDVLIDVRRSWAPLGADRFYNLIKVGALNDVAFFRVVEGFMAQVGIPGDPEIARIWRDAKIADDPVTQGNKRGTISFATSGKNSRVNQFFINLVDNGRLDPMGFAPFGVVRDMPVVDQLYSGYGEGAPRGRGPMQGRIQREGNAYLQAQFPELDYIKFAKVTKEFKAPPPAPHRVSH